MSSFSSSSERPTLPPLHTLNLLPASFAPHHRGDSPYHSSVPKPSWAYPRRVSISSSSTSRTPSPSPSDSGSSSSSTSSTSAKLKLVPCAFADADAVVVIPPPGAPGQGQTLMLTGPALAHLRHPQRQIAKGTRLHPYRFAATRRASVASSASSSPR
ncbi:hypothetical protein C8R46DRAFT_1344823 [Mycena filopes]|nr:hypothetical protein C8R46DRAFT_1344823 [Mycena filopes]